MENDIAEDGIHDDDMLACPLDPGQDDDCFTIVIEEDKTDHSGASSYLHDEVGGTEKITNLKRAVDRQDKTKQNKKKSPLESFDSSVSIIAKYLEDKKSAARVKDQTNKQTNIIDAFCQYIKAVTKNMSEEDQINLSLKLFPVLNEAIKDHLKNNSAESNS